VIVTAPPEGFSPAAGRPASLSRPSADAPSRRERTALLLRVAGLFRPYRAKVALMLTIAVLQAVAGVTPPFFIAAMINSALPERNTGLLTALALGCVAAAGLGSALSVASQRLTTELGQQVMHDVRLAVYTHLQRMSLAFFTRTRAGELQSRIANDIGRVDNILISTAATGVQSVATVAAVSAALVILDWKLAICALAVVPAFMALTYGVGRRRREVVASRQARLGSLSALIEESMSVAGVLLAKTMGRQSELRQQFDRESRSISDLEVRIAMMGRWRLAARKVSLAIIPAVVYWVAGMTVGRGAAILSTGALVASVSLTNRMVSPASSLQGIGVNVSTSMAIFDRIFEILDLPVDIEERHGARTVNVRRASISLRDVYFRYDQAGPWTLRGVSLDIPAGATTAIVGHTGSGKTTLAYLIARLYEPEAGEVRIDGTDMRDATLSSLAATVGFVSQETYLFHDTIAENLRFARPGASDADLAAAARAARVHEVITALPDGYQTMVGERGYRFSGGERQRLAIARLLLRNPPVVVLDEATSALDNETERAVQDTLEKFAADRTVIVVAHRLSTIRNASQVIVMDHGQVAEHGTLEELAARDGHYARLAGLVAAGAGLQEAVTAGAVA
jgi:ATP-binding cassette, subfamily B, bacterial